MLSILLLLPIVLPIDRITGGILQEKDDEREIALTRYFCKSITGTSERYLFNTLY